MNHRIFVSIIAFVVWSAMILGSMGPATGVGAPPHAESSRDEPAAPGAPDTTPAAAGGYRKPTRMENLERLRRSFKVPIRSG